MLMATTCERRGEVESTPQICSQKWRRGYSFWPIHARRVLQSLSLTKSAPIVVSSDETIHGEHVSTKCTASASPSADTFFLGKLGMLHSK